MIGKANHTLIITVDDEMLKRAQEEDPTVSPLDQEFWQIRIRCKADPNDYSRVCLMWLECECKLTEEQRDELSCDGEGPCPESPTGVHQDCVGDLSPARPTEGCWARWCDNSHEFALDLAEKYHLGPGEHPIHVHPEHESIEFELAVGPA